MLISMIRLFLVLERMTKMKKAFRSGLALFLCLIMALSLIPASAADDIEIIDIKDEDDVLDVLEDEELIPVVEPEDLTDPDVEIQSTIIASGTCGDDLAWTLDDEGTLTISGTGEMDNASWYFYRPRIQSVIICNGMQNSKHNYPEKCNEYWKLRFFKLQTIVRNSGF